VATKKPLTSSSYNILLREVRKLLLASKKRAPDAKLTAYWNIGSEIAARQLKAGASFSHSIIQDLAADTRLAQRTLYDAVEFHAAYKKPPEQPGITWTHYRLLLRLATEKDRKFYIRLIANESWSTRRLESAINAGMHEGKSFDQAILKRPTDPQYVYLVELRRVLDADTLDLDVDLGFGVIRRMRTRVASIDALELKVRGGRAARNFVLTELGSAKTLVIKSIKSDLHGRYLAHIFYSTRQVDIQECFKSGVYLNELLVQKKHADALP